MIEWMLTFILVANVNGRAVERPVTAYAETAEACIGLLLAQQKALPKNARVVQPRCREVRRT